MGTFLVSVLRTESISFEVEAESREDAEARYLMDGEETGSKTVDLSVESVENVT